ncbi:MAG: hypothetical protein DDT33_01673 [Firmicutes bacterium]|nr:hypothetical protein [Bacillota bacterium]
MIKQNAVASEKVIPLAIVRGHPIGINFGCSIGTSGAEGRILILRWRSTAKHLTAGSLVKFALYAIFSYGFQQSGSAKSGNISGVFWRIKANTHMALGS